MSCGYNCIAFKGQSNGDGLSFVQKDGKGGGGGEMGVCGISGIPARRTWFVPYRNPKVDGTQHFKQDVPNLTSNLHN